MYIYLAVPKQFLYSSTCIPKDLTDVSLICPATLEARQTVILTLNVMDHLKFYNNVWDMRHEALRFVDNVVYYKQLVKGFPSAEQYSFQNGSLTIMETKTVDKTTFQHIKISNFRTTKPDRRTSTVYYTAY